jgi:hypothetical protein
MNIISNIVYIEAADAEIIQKIRQDLRTNQGVFDFNAVSPLPADSDIFNATGVINAETEAKYGKNNWRDWRWDNWGTDCNSRDAVLRRCGEMWLEYSFDSSWDSPELVIKALSAKYGVTVKCSHCGEERRYGVYGYANGKRFLNLRVKHPSNLMAVMHSELPEKEVERRLAVK